MWTSSNQRIKALMSARAREKERLCRPIHVLRADVTLKIQDSSGEIPIAGRALLNDFTTDGIQLYSASSLMPNVDLIFEIRHPRVFQIEGRVVWCQYQSSQSHVITSHAFPYRVGIAFRFKNREEEAAFKSFCQEMHAAYCENQHLALLNQTQEQTATAKDPKDPAQALAALDDALTEGSQARETPPPDEAAPATEQQAA